MVAPDPSTAVEPLPPALNSRPGPACGSGERGFQELINGKYKSFYGNHFHQHCASSPLEHDPRPPVSNTRRSTVDSLTTPGRNDSSIVESSEPPTAVVPLPPALNSRPGLACGSGERGFQNVSHVSTLHKHLSVPVTCKIRIFEDLAKTIRYAKMLQDAGCQMLTVHGRTREQKGPLTGVADWRYVKTLRGILKIPILSNGNIMSVDDIHRCLEETGANGVMTAEGNLFNPFLFEGFNPPAWTVAYEYLDIVEKYPAPISYVRGHLFKIFHHLMNLTPNAALREQMATCRNVSEFRAIVGLLEEKYLPFHEGRQVWTNEESSLPVLESESEAAANHLSFNLALPPWLCQPYIRAPPEVHRQKLEEASRLAANPDREKRQFYDQEGNEISRKKMKKMRRVQRRPNRAGLLPGDPERDPGRRFDEICKNAKTDCTNPMGLKCASRLCRICCRNRCFHENLDCVGHKIFIKSRREKAKTLTEAEMQQAKGNNNNDQQQPSDGEMTLDS
ncbi:tRNA-dihydrouridine(16/17) synthase [NAD(P)(+)]-like [Wyeomyia smithii]|uniref:tRNA-dihydrouridine(16/17) synthase [NAD(P)(+)]-like n=1 Tax=Wyeomyia smithii TaxID=174621 RepID=UPI002467C6A2|nr:tRNA-dihydrouridine(16/17) synthase [NAD(P)(+)]-like [Wyeomyia smithii]